MYQQKWTAVHNYITWFILVIYISLRYYHSNYHLRQCPILLMPSATLGSGKYQFYKSLVWLNWELSSRSPTREACVPPIRPAHLVDLTEDEILTDDSLCTGRTYGSRRSGRSRRSNDGRTIHTRRTLRPGRTCVSGEACAIMGVAELQASLFVGAGHPSNT